MPNLFALLDAFGNLSDKAHLGEATDIEEGQPMAWKTCPYFSAAWYLDFSMQPGELVRLSPDATAVEKCCAIYIKKKDIEAQLWQKKLIGGDLKEIADYIMEALEGIPENGVATSSDRVHEQIRLEFHVPAVASWMRYAGPDIFKHVVQEEGGL